MGRLNVDPEEMCKSLNTFLGTFQEMQNNYLKMVDTAAEVAKETGIAALIDFTQKAVEAAPAVVKNYNGAIETINASKEYYTKLLEATGNV